MSTSDDKRTVSPSSRLSQFGFYRTIDARTDEFLKLSRKRQIRQGCACAALTTAITVTVVVGILLVVEYNASESRTTKFTKKAPCFDLFHDSAAKRNFHNNINVEERFSKLFNLLRKIVNDSNLSFLIEDSIGKETTELPNEEDILPLNWDPIPSKTSTRIRKMIPIKPNRSHSERGRTLKNERKLNDCKKKHIDLDKGLRPSVKIERTIQSTPTSKFPPSTDAKTLDKPVKINLKLPFFHLSENKKVNKNASNCICLQKVGKTLKNLAKIIIGLQEIVFEIMGLHDHSEFDEVIQTSKTKGAYYLTPKNIPLSINTPRYYYKTPTPTSTTPLPLVTTTRKHNLVTVRKRNFTQTTTTFKYNYLMTKHKERTTMKPETNNNTKPLNTDIQDINMNKVLISRFRPQKKNSEIPSKEMLKRLCFRRQPITTMEESAVLTQTSENSHDQAESMSNYVNIRYITEAKVAPTTKLEKPSNTMETFQKSKKGIHNNDKFTRLYFHRHPKEQVKESDVVLQTTKRDKTESFSSYSKRFIPEQNEILETTTAVKTEIIDSSTKSTVDKNIVIINDNEDSELDTTVTNSILIKDLLKLDNHAFELLKQNFLPQSRSTPFLLETNNHENIYQDLKKPRTQVRHGNYKSNIVALVKAVFAKESVKNNNNLNGVTNEIVGSHAQKNGEHSRLTYKEEIKNIRNRKIESKNVENKKHDEGIQDKEILKETYAFVSNPIKRLNRKIYKFMLPNFAADTSSDSDTSSFNSESESILLNSRPSSYLDIKYRNDWEEKNRDDTTVPFEFV